MKRTVALIAALFMVLIVALFSYYAGWKDGADHDTSTTYETPAIVDEVNTKTGWVTFVDWDGEAWCIRGDGYELDQLVILVFNDNSTEDIYDDLIINVKCLVDIEEVE